MDVNTEVMRNVSVLIPVYNEEKTIAQILEKVLALPFLHEVVIIDDCSVDSSAQIIKSYEDPRIVFEKLPVNSGKTAAISRAVERASGEILIVQDADLEYDPEEIADVIAPIQKGVADVVYGSRFLVKKACRILYFYHFLANKFLTFLSNMLINLNMTDVETCYKAFRSDILKNLTLTSKGFGMEVEITAMASKLPVRFYEVPISYYGRTYEEGKKIGMKDGIMAIWYILYYNLIAVHSMKNQEYIKKLTEIYSKKK